MPEAERIYRDRSYEELIDLRNKFRREMREAERDSRRAWGDHNPEDGAMYDRRALSLNQGISEIGVEFDARAREKEARRKEREARQAQKARRRDAGAARRPPAESSDLTGGALARWFSQMLTEPLGVTTDRVELIWELQGRRYFATYTPADSALAVWVQVKPGTPDATVMGDGHFMSANNRRELGRALDAEKRARGQ